MLTLQAIWLAIVAYRTGGYTPKTYGASLMKQTIQLKAGERIKIFSRSFSSMPLEYTFQARSLGPDQLNGEVEILATQLFFPKPPEKLPLSQHNVVKAGIWDTFMNVYVVAHSDLEVTLPRRGLSHLRWLVGLLMLVVLVAVIMVLATG